MENNNSKKLTKESLNKMIHDILNEELHKERKKAVMESKLKTVKAEMAELMEHYGQDALMSELFGFGKKAIALNAIKPSQNAVAFVTKHPAARNAIGEFKKHYNMDDNLAKNAVMAVYDFAGGVPLLGKYGFDFNPQTMTLTIDPNKGGLFTGHPIMGQ